MADPWYIELIKLVGPIIGGAIAACIGFLAVSYQTKRKTANERRIFYRTKLEQLFEKSSEYQSLAHPLVFDIKYKNIPYHDIIRRGDELLSEMDMLVSLYFPHLKNHYDKISDSWGLVTLWAMLQTDEKDNPDNIELHLPRDEVFAAAQLRRQIADEIKNYRP